MILVTNYRPLSDIIVSGAPVPEDDLHCEALYDRGGGGAAERAEFDPLGKSVLHYEQPGVPVDGTR